MVRVSQADNSGERMSAASTSGDEQTGSEAADTATGERPSAAQVLSRARSFVNTVEHLRSEPGRLQRQARQQHDQLHQRVVAEQLQAMPLEKLRETINGKLALSALDKAGLRSVFDVASTSSERLQRYPGIGEKTAEATLAAAGRVKQAVERQAVFRFDPDNRDDRQATLLGTLRAEEVGEKALSDLGPQIETVTTQVDELTRQARRTGSSLRMLFSRRRKKNEALEALQQLATLLDDPRVAQAYAGDERLQHALGEQDPRELWRDYQQRAATYNTLLARITGADEVGDSPRSVSPEVQREVSRLSLDTSLLRVQLRGYQIFGAKYALARKRSILGDEMGLGKTVEALAAMADLDRRGRRHFVVVCPAGVLLNWIDETGRHSGLVPHRLHGQQRDRALHEWKREGGVAVTTYQTLQLLPDLHGARIDMLVVDEAHYVKHPGRARSRAVAEVANRTEHVLFLTGTPMENRLDEFKNLVFYLQPRIAERISTEDALMGPEAFRKAVAPVYLRRNQQDVLTELPEKLELDEWVELDGADARSYREAVASRNFMAMRRAAYAPGTVEKSAKLTRLLDIIEEAAQNDRKVVVFSRFHNVIDTVCGAVGEAALTPFTGRLTAEAKQRVLNEFDQRGGHAVLVAQIEAGGVGINLQRASIVIIAEPQDKPATEEQAIGRSHRMGQAHMVHVHRLMAKDTVDQRLQEVLEGKERLFDAYARQSAVKTSDAAATDTATVNHELLHDEAVPLPQRIVEVERQRLGID